MSSRIYPTLVIVLAIFLGPKSFPQPTESYLHIPPTGVKTGEDVEIVILLIQDDPVVSGMLFFVNRVKSAIRKYRWNTMLDHG